MKSRLGQVAALGVLVAMGAGPVLAGDGNKLYLLQEGEGPGGNTFLSNQVSASNTSIGSELVAAHQAGSMNSANLTLLGYCGDLCGVPEFEQDNTADTLDELLRRNVITSVPSTLIGNFSKVTVTSPGTAIISQLGDNNRAFVSVWDDGGSGTIAQSGLNNVATLDVSGGIKGTITQTGMDNRSNIAISGPSTATVSVTQTGNGLNYSAAGGDPLTINTTTYVTVEQYSN